MSPVPPSRRHCTARDCKTLYEKDAIRHFGCILGVTLRGIIYVYMRAANIDALLMDLPSFVEEEPAPCPRARPVTSALARNDAAGLGIASSVWLLLLLSVKQMVLLVESK